MRIRVHPLCYLYFVSMAILTSWQTAVGAIAALFVHEFGHIAACCLTGDSIAQIELTPVGGMMTYAHGKVPSKGVKGSCVAVAGPVANYLFLMFLGTFPDLFESTLRKAIIVSNAAMFCLNLAPVLPLDGGRILFCLGYYVFPVIRLILFLSRMGIAAGIVFVLFAVYGAIQYGCLNCSILIVGLYLAYCAWICRSQMTIENLYAIIQEKMDDTRQLRPIKLYQVTEEIRLTRLVPLLAGSYLCEFICTMKETEYRITEKELCKKLLEQPFLSVGEAFSFSQS